MTTTEVLSEAHVREAVFSHAQACYPREACGLLVESPDGGRAVLSTNLADDRNAARPSHPGAAHHAYVLNPLEIVEARRKGGRLVAIFHSHCDLGSYFSEDDRAQALAPRVTAGASVRPLYPDVDYVVLNAHDDGVRGFGVYRFDAGHADFTEVYQEGDLRGRRRTS